MDLIQIPLGDSERFRFIRSTYPYIILSGENVKSLGNTTETLRRSFQMIKPSICGKIIEGKMKESEGTQSFGYTLDNQRLK